MLTVTFLRNVFYQVIQVGGVFKIDIKRLFSTSKVRANYYITETWMNIQFGFCFQSPFSFIYDSS